MLIGQSLGGLLATEILVKKPTLFNQYVIISPSLWWDNESLLSQKPVFLQADFGQKTDVFIAVGKEGSVMEADARGLVALVGQGSTIRSAFQSFGDETHATLFHLAVYRAFQFLNQKH